MNLVSYAMLIKKITIKVEKVTICKAQHQVKPVKLANISNKEAPKYHK